MEAEEYGLSMVEYRRLIEDATVTAKDISKVLKTPEKVYRFRRLGHDENGLWKESPHWEDDVNGICRFSIPNSFNKNDSEDCKVYFDEEVILDYIFRNEFNAYNREARRKVKSIAKRGLKEYRKTLQGTMKVGCFTAVNYTNIAMWNDKYFGDNGRGICIEYKIDDENFRPDELSFLPVLYDDVHYDNTEVMKAVIDFAKNNHNTEAARKMVCLGFGHTLIKPTEFEKEHEWRLVIPIRDDGAHTHYFNVDNDSKRDMTQAISAIYLAPNFDSLDEAGKYKAAILAKWSPKEVPIYQVRNVGGTMVAHEIFE